MDVNSSAGLSDADTSVFLPPGVYYDGFCRVFRLRCKSSLYVFRVDDKRNLEHLYWGPPIPSGDDMSYLSGSHDPAPFDPQGLASIANKLGLDELREIEDVPELLESWRVFTKVKNHPGTEKALLKSRRLENASWRLWHMQRIRGGDVSEALQAGAVQRALQISSQQQPLSTPIVESPSTPATPVARSLRGDISTIPSVRDSKEVTAEQSLQQQQQGRRVRVEQGPIPRSASGANQPSVSFQDAVRNGLSTSSFLGPVTPGSLPSGIRQTPLVAGGAGAVLRDRPRTGGLRRNGRRGGMGMLGSSIANASVPHSLYRQGMDEMLRLHAPSSDLPLLRRSTSIRSSEDSKRTTPATLTPVGDRQVEELVPQHLVDGEGGSMGARYISGLDLEGHRGRRLDLEEKMIHKIQEEVEEEESIKAHMEDGSGSESGMTHGEESMVEDLTAPLSVQLPTLSVLDPTQGTGAPLSPGAVRRADGDFGDGSLAITPRLDGGSSRGGGLRSPSPARKWGMGSKKQSFAALESLGTSSAEHLPLLAGVDTNWARLDPIMVGKSSKLLEFSDYGTGDFRESSFKVLYESNGSTVSPLEYHQHRVLRIKPPMPNHMPSLYTESDDESTTLVIEMVDRTTGLSVNLYFTVYHNYDVITRRSEVVNASDGDVCLHHLMSATVDFDAEDAFYMTQLSGGWARERQIVTRKLDDGLTMIQSSRGASSHQFNPFLVISPNREPEEDEGECYSFCLAYSGNFIGTAEVTEYRRLRVNMGINPEGFTWHLDAKKKDKTPDSFCTPEVILSYSSQGMGKMSRELHRVFRERLLPKRWRYRVPPILLNTWEAMYFNVSHELVLDIARKAATTGIELLVLDDGWFGKRDNTFSGLGDWRPNKSKLPYGLKGLAEAVNELGLQFGIWVEPEMVSVDSELFRKHPKWCLHEPARERTTGRNQLVLDFSQQVVRDNIYGQLKEMLDSANITYVKWDMNRHLTEVFSQKWDKTRQGEIAHRHVLGVYEVLDRITTKFPHVLFESCSGGGGRFDAGMLYYTPQIWASDNTDALSRVRIQYGTSLAYPASAIGAHVSTVPNHQTHRTTSVKVRSLLAMSGTFGYELDPRGMSQKEVEEVQEYIRLQKRVAPLVYEGDMYRLRSPFRTDSGAWMFVSRDKREAVVIAANINKEVGRLEPRLKLKGLDPTLMYAIDEQALGHMARNPDTMAMEYVDAGVYQLGKNIRLAGITLCRAGLPIKFMFDADSVVFLLHAVGMVRHV